MAIEGAYKRWPYPVFSTPFPPAPEAAPDLVPVQWQFPRRKPQVFSQFELVQEATEPPPWIEQSWEYPRRKTWLHSELETAREPIPIVIPPWIQNPWEYPFGKPWQRPGLGKLVDIERPDQVDIQWYVPLSEPVRTPVWIPFVPLVEPPPPRTELKPPFTQWHIPRRIVHQYDTWQPWVPVGGEFGLFTPVEWQFPRRKTRIFEPFGLLDFTDRDYDFVPVTHPHPTWFPPVRRIIDVARYVPLKELETPEEELGEFIPNCPRPLRRPDTKC